MFRRRAKKFDIGTASLPNVQSLEKGMAISESFHAILYLENAVASAQCMQYTDILLRAITSNIKTTEATRPSLC